MHQLENKLQQTGVYKGGIYSIMQFSIIREPGDIVKRIKCVRKLLKHKIYKLI